MALNDSANVTSIGGGGGNNGTKKKDKDKKTKRGKNSGGGKAAHEMMDSQLNKSFNRLIRTSVEAGNHAEIIRLLEDGEYGGCTLDQIVLEGVMKNFVISAQFEDALRCLKKNTAPVS